MPFRISHLVLVCLAVCLAAACGGPAVRELGGPKWAITSPELGVWLRGVFPHPERSLMRPGQQGIRQEAAPKIVLRLNGRDYAQYPPTPMEGGSSWVWAEGVVKPGGGRFEITTGIYSGRLVSWLLAVSSLEVDMSSPDHRFKGRLEAGQRLQILGDQSWEIEQQQHTGSSIASIPDAPYLSSAVRQLRLWQARPGRPLPGVFGLLDRKFEGRVFWDHDLWIFPALSLLDPDSARAIVDYRLRTLPEARKAAKEGARIPWEADPAGRDMAQGEAEKSLGAGPSAAWMLNRAAQLGLADPVEARRAQQEIAQFFLSVSEPGPQGRSIRDVRSIDEYVIVDNDLFLQAGVDLLWQRLGVSQRAKLPRSPEGELLNYEPDTGRPMQQAAGMLAAWPLEHPEAARKGPELVDRWLPRVIKNGPRMSVSVAATILARDGRAEEARRLWMNEIKANEGPFFREKPLNPEAPFITGVAGLVNTVLYGFIGIDIGPNEPARAAWKKRLKSGAWIWANPHVPDSWERIIIGPIYLDGEPFRLTAKTGSLSVMPFNPSPEPAQ